MASNWHKLSYDKVGKPNGHLFFAVSLVAPDSRSDSVFFPLSCSHMLSFFVYFIGLNVKGYVVVVVLD